MKDEKKDGKRIVLPPNRAHTEMALGNFDPIGNASDSEHGSGNWCSNRGSAPQKKEKEKKD